MLMIKAFSDVYHESPKMQAIEIKDGNSLDPGPGSGTKKDVKNEGRTDYMHENKQGYDRMSAGLACFFL